MLQDLVVDTNVFVHASNPDNEYYEAALLLATTLTTAGTALCVDEGFNPVEANNRSLIGGEYNERLVLGMIGYAVIATLAASGLVKQVPKAVPPAVRQRIQRLVPRKPRDRTFVHVAYNSADHVLASHDFDDFAPNVRRALRRDIDVHISTAEQVIALLSA